LRNFNYLNVRKGGFIADPADDVGPLFDWYGSGEAEVRWPGMGMVSHVAPPSAAYLQDTIKRAGALVVGGRHPGEWAARRGPG